jgi:hypothetical protein
MPQGSGGLTMEFPSPPRTKQWNYLTHNTLAKEKSTKDKQRSTNHTYKTKNRVTRTPLKTEGEFRCSGRVSSSCSTSDTTHVNPVTKPGDKSCTMKVPGTVYDKWNLHCKTLTSPYHFTKRRSMGPSNYCLPATLY